MSRYRFSPINTLRLLNGTIFRLFYDFPYFEKKQAKIKDLELKAKKLRKEIQKLKAETNNLQVYYRIDRDKLQQIIITNARLAKLSLEKVATLSEYADKESSLDDRIKKKQDTIESLEQMETFLRSGISDIKRVDELLRMRVQSFVCGYCGGSTLKILKRKECDHVLLSKFPLTVSCFHCGTVTPYDLKKILLEMSLEILS